MQNGNLAGNVLQLNDHDIARMIVGNRSEGISIIRETAHQAWVDENNAERPVTTDSGQVPRWALNAGALFP